MYMYIQAWLLSKLILLPYCNPDFHYVKCNNHNLWKGICFKNICTCVKLYRIQHLKYRKTFYVDVLHMKVFGWEILSNYVTARSFCTNHFESKETYIHCIGNSSSAVRVATAVQYTEVHNLHKWGVKKKVGINIIPLWGGLIKSFVIQLLTHCEEST